jgi:hypothetical protein
VHAGTFFRRLALERFRFVTVDRHGFFLAHQTAVRREHREEFQRPEESVEAEIANQEHPQFGDLVLAQMGAQIVPVVIIEGIRIRRDFLDIAHDRLLLLGEDIAAGMVVDAVVEEFFVKSFPLRRSRTNVASITAMGHARQHHPDDFLELVVEGPLVKDTGPEQVRLLGEVHIVTHDRVEAGVRRAQFEGFLDIRLELGLLQLFDIEQGDIRHIALSIVWC